MDMSKCHACHAKCREEVVCVTKLWATKLSVCVCDKVVCVCERREAASEQEAEARSGIQNQKQEPYIELWGISIL